MLPMARTVVQNSRDVKASGSPPIGSRMLNATAVPPMIPPSCSSLDRASTAHSRFTQPIPKIFGGTLA
jgi:hypothetical protein